MVWMLVMLMVVVVVAVMVVVVMMTKDLVLGEMVVEIDVLPVGQVVLVLLELLLLLDNQLSRLVLLLDDQLSRLLVELELALMMLDMVMMVVVVHVMQFSRSFRRQVDR